MKKLLVIGAAVAALSATPANAGGWSGVGAGIAAGIIAGAIASQARQRVIYVYPRVRYVRPRVQRSRVQRVRAVQRARSRQPQAQSGIMN
jgi:hypothetical protein